MRERPTSNMTRLIFATFVAFLTACVPLKTTEHSDENYGSGGVPYVLPTSVMAVEVEVLRNAEKEFQDVRFKLTPRLVPDPDSGIYYLSSKLNALFQSDHDISVKNGLLSSVNTIDVGTSGDVLLSVVNSGVNLYKYREASAFAQSETANPLLTANPNPTPEEIQYILGLIQGDKMAFNYQPAIGLGRQDLPGTDRVLFIRSRIEKAGESNPSEPICKAYVDVEYDGDSEDTDYVFGRKKSGTERSDHNGVLTRLLESRTAQLRLCVDGPRLLAMRVAALKVAYETTEKGRKDLLKTLGEQKKDRGRLCEEPYEVEHERRKERRKNLSDQLDSLSKLKLNDVTAARLAALTSRIADVEKKMAKLISEIEICETHTKNIKSTERSMKTSDNKLCELAGLAEKNGRVLLKKCVDDVLIESTPQDREYKDCSDDFDVLCGDYPIKQNSDVVMLAKKEVLRIPVWRAGFGKTENSLTFSDGILTSFHSKHPSAVQVAAVSVEAGLKSLVSLPAELVQLKIDLTNKEKTLAEGQKELQDALDQLSDEVSRQREIDSEIKLLQAELRLAQASAQVQAGLDTVESVGFRARLEEEQRLLELRSEVAGARVTLNEQQSALSGTRADTGETEDQIELLRQQNLLRQQEVERNQQLSSLSGTRAETSQLEDQIARLQQQNLLREQQQTLDPEIAALDREAAVLNARREILEAELELERTRKEILELERELEELQEPDGGE